MSVTSAEPIIKIKDLHFHYNSESEHPIHAIKGIDLEIRPGDYLVIVGHNGSGKSTLAKNLNVLLKPTEGDVWVEGLNTRDAANTLAIRSSVGMVFQIPDNQIVATIVEQDVAFGPENLGLDRHEIIKRVDWALQLVDMPSYRMRSPTQLSGGQKQRVAIAASLAMLPEIMILDEPTSGLDPIGRFEVFSVIERLCRERQMTIVMVSQNAEHVAEFSDRLAVMWHGRIARHDVPRRVFEDAEFLEEVGIAAPQVTELALALNGAYGSTYDFMRIEEAERALAHDLGKGAAL